MGAQEQRLACVVIRQMEPRCQQGLSGLLLSERVISPAQRLLFLTTHSTLKNRHPCPRRYSNPHSQ